MLKNSTKGYGLIHILLHWISALVVVGLFALGLWMTDLSYYDQWYHKAPGIHKSIGLLLAIATLFRIVWKITQATPTPIGNALEKVGAKLAHIGLYILLISIFISGYLISTADGHSIEVFNWFSIPSLGKLFEGQADIAGEIHEWLAFGLIGLAVLHAVAALKHHFINKDDTLKRIVLIKTGEK